MNQPAEPTLALSAERLLDLDAAHVWHPYSGVEPAYPLFPVIGASGVELELADGRRLLDGMSSWWSAIHGYRHPQMDAALKAQIDTMSHVMFGGLTHPGAVRLCQRLVELSPAGLTRVFLSDSGSVAVEVAVKMALQYWQSQGQGEKSRLLSLAGGYHGDTFMAMSVCDPVNGMHHLFSGAMAQQHFAPRPSARYGEEVPEEEISALRALFEQHHTSLAAFILEPVVQGAGGMWFYAPEYLRVLRDLCDEFEVLLIADEIATGFGRTGRLFACEHASISPDILCLGKALTGGYMTMAATLCNEVVARGICDGEAGVLMHGPTFMGNPLGCAAANASLDILLAEDWPANIQRIEAALQRGLAPARDLPTVADVRVLGAIGVIEMQRPTHMAVLQPALVEAGIWLRPFGKLVYTMPPYVMLNDQLARLCGSAIEVLACLGETALMPD
ncbi:MAG: adenosylmethionine--8-amino-7-oxononanoate transaminase [Pseudomonadota bacterium]